MADPVAGIRPYLRSLATRIVNMVARGPVTLADDSRKLRSVQAQVVADSEPTDAGEHFEPYGFTSVPLAGAEALLLFPNGDRSHPIVVQVTDRRSRPTGKEPGEVTVYNNTGASVTITKDGDIIAKPAPGRTMQVFDAGSAVALATKADLDAVVTYLKKQFSSATGHVHATPSGPTTTITESSSGTSGTCPAPAGTSVLKAQ